MRPTFMKKASLLLLAALAVGCGDTEEPSGPTVVTIAPEGEAFGTLAEWGLFTDGAKQIPNTRVEPYDVIAPLYSDDAAKRRFVFIPEGATIAYQPEALWGLPEGTVLIKTFSFPLDAGAPSGGERLIETRLLVNQPSGWEAHTYVWDEAQTTARREVAGEVLQVAWTDGAGVARDQTYVVPNENECKECHAPAMVLDTLGLRTRQIDRAGEDGMNQIDRLAMLGWFDSAPPDAGARERLVDPSGNGDVADRARSYMDANCAHCHSPDSAASQSGLWLDWPNTAPTEPDANWGVCKVPTSAAEGNCGLTYDIVPGAPESSIMVCRMESEDPQERMPSLGTLLADDPGVALVSAWISGMPDASCSLE